MLTRFTVGNFFAFKDKHTISLSANNQSNLLPEALFDSNNKKFLKSIVIYGPNASGKSTLIRAFSVFRQTVINSFKMSLEPASIIPVQSFLLSTDTEKEPSFFEVEIAIKNKVYIYGFEASSQRIYKEWLQQYPNKKILFNRGLNLSKIKTNPRYFKEGILKNALDLRENVLLLSALATLKGEISRQIVDEISKIQALGTKSDTLNYSFNKYNSDPLYQAKQKQFVLDADLSLINITPEERILTREQFSKKLPPHIANFANQARNLFERNLKMSHNKFDSNGKKLGLVDFNFFQESEGTQHLFALSGPLVDSLEKGNLLIIDELDSSLHPLMCRYILKIFNSQKYNPNNAQLIITTHDTSLLDDEILRRDQVWFTQKNNIGASDLFSLSSLGERSNLDFAKRYLEGRYGAIPYIKLLEDIE